MNTTLTLQVIITSLEALTKLLDYIQDMNNNGIEVHTPAELNELANKLRAIPDLPEE